MRVVYLLCKTNTNATFRVSAGAPLPGTQLCISCPWASMAGDLIQGRRMREDICGVSDPHQHRECTEYQRERTNDCLLQNHVQTTESVSSVASLSFSSSIVAPQSDIHSSGSTRNIN